MFPLYLHRTYFDSPPVLFRKAWEYGFQGVELNAPGLAPADDIDRDMDGLARLKEKWLAGEIILHFPMSLLTDGPWAAREDVFTRMERSFARAAKILGVRRVNTMTAPALVPPGNAYTDYPKNGSAGAAGIYWERAPELLRRAADLASAHGIELVVETHGCLLHDRPETMLRLLELTGRRNVKVNIDLPNLVLVKDSQLRPEEVEPLVARAGHVHLKNLRMVLGGGYLLEGIGAGVVDHLPLMRRLRETGYRGGCSLELPGLCGDADDAVRRDAAFARKLLVAADEAQ